MYRFPDKIEAARSCVASRRDDSRILLSWTVVVLCTAPALRIPADVTIGGNRPTVVHVPEIHDPDVPAPLMLVLHGLWRDPLTSPAQIIEGWLRFMPLADERGFLLAYPEARLQGGEWRWNLGGEDAEYIRGLVDEASEILNIDRDRIFLVGYSRGCRLAYQVACDHDDTITAFAAAAHRNDVGCPSAPVHALAILGTEDSSYRDGVQSIESWAGPNGCSLNAVPSGVLLDLITDRVGPDTTIRRFEECFPHAAAELWTIVGGTHTPSWTTSGRSTSLAVGITDWLLNHPRRPSPVAMITAEPPSGTYPLAVTLDGSGSAAPESDENVAVAAYHWSLGDEIRVEGPVVEHTYSLPGRYPVTLQVVTDDERVSLPARVSITAVCPSGATAPWEIADVGEPAFPLGARFEVAGEDSVLEVCAGGRVIGGRADECSLLQQALEGDVSLVAGIDDLESGVASAAVGVMFRTDLDPAAPFVAMLLETVRAGTEQSARFRLRYRDEAGRFARAGSGEPVDAVLGGQVRLDRRGNTFHAWSRAAGGEWTRVGESVDIPEAPPRLVGGLVAVGQDVGADSYQPMHARVSVLEAVSLPPIPTFLRGDCNDDGTVDISDAIFSLGSLFLGQGDPSCDDACDSNDDGDVDSSDAVATLGMLFLGNGVIPFPGMTECGVDPTDDELECESYGACE